MSVPQKFDLVLCPRLGEEQFEIIEDHSITREWKVRSTKNNKETMIYKAHCHIPSNMALTNMRMRRERKLKRAAQVGNPTPKKK